MQSVISGIILGLVIIAILEVCRYFRWISRSSREFQELKKRVEQLEEKLRNLDNK